MTEYFRGEKLYGDEFSFEQIEKWYKEEENAYADLSFNKNNEEYTHSYYELNNIYGFNKIKKSNFDKVLGFGSALGYEFEPIIDIIKELTIIEPADHLKSSKIGHIIPKYVKPNIDGRLTFDDNTFDLVCCFGTLHHIPNVSFVLEELLRVLKINGYLLIREPIISMGDWRQPRKGLTKNERGIPVAVFDKVFNKNKNVEIIAKNYCFTATSIIQRLVGKVFKKPIYAYKPYLYFDKFISWLLKSNVHYHATKKIQRIAPSSIFYIVKKK